MACGNKTGKKCFHIKSVFYYGFLLNNIYIQYIFNAVYVNCMKYTLYPDKACIICILTIAEIIISS